METKKWFVDHIQPDWVMIDCGANIGYFSILFAKYAELVYAFEPTSTHDMLLKNIHYNNIRNVITLKCAVGNKTGDYTDKIFRVWNNGPEENEYPFTTIDNFDIPKIDCIKIDVDSYDFEALQGARETLLKHNPYVMVELNHALEKRGQTKEQAIEWMRELGYPGPTVFDKENYLFRR